MIRLYNWHGRYEEFDSLSAAQSWVMAEFRGVSECLPRWEETPTLDANIVRVTVADTSYLLVKR